MRTSFFQGRFVICVQWEKVLSGTSRRATGRRLRAGTSREAEHHHGPTEVFACNCFCLFDFACRGSAPAVGWLGSKWQSTSAARGRIYREFKYLAHQDRVVIGFINAPCGDRDLLKHAAQPLIQNISCFYFIYE
jgi:hypothetical protein